MKTEKDLKKLGKRTIYTVAIGNFSVPPTEEQKKVANIIRDECHGLIAVHPAYPHGTLLMFDSLNNAKECRNVLQYEGVQTGNHIVEAEFDFETNTMGEGRIAA